MKRLCKNILVTCFSSLSFLFFVTLASGYYGSPVQGQQYPQLSQQNSSQPITININLPSDSQQPININVNFSDSESPESNQVSDTGYTPIYPSYPSNYVGGYPSGYNPYASIYPGYPPSYPYYQESYGYPTTYPAATGSTPLTASGPIGSPLPVSNPYISNSYSMYPAQSPASGYTIYPQSPAYGTPVPAFSSGVMGGTNVYGSPWITYLPPTSESIEAAQSKFGIMCSAMDGDYLYASVLENGGQYRGAVAIFEATDSGEYTYLSHIVLSEGGGSWYNPNGISATPGKIAVKDNLAVIGGNTLGMVYLLDISDKTNPTLISSLKLAGEDDNGADRVLGLAIEGQVLFVCVEDLDGLEYNDKYTVYALDISDPVNMNKDDNLLDSYELDSDYKVYNMASAPGHLYLPGKKCVKENYGLTIHIIDTSDPQNLSLVGIFNQLGSPAAREPELSVATDGNYLLATVEASEEVGPFSDAAYRLNIIDISDPSAPQIISSSKKLDGDQYVGDRDILVKDNYAYLIASSSMPSKAKIYVFDISNPNVPDLVDISESVNGQGVGLYFMKDNRLCLHAGDKMAIFDMSNPEDLSLVKTIDLEGLMEDKLADWGGTAGEAPAYYPFTPYGTGSSPAGTDSSTAGTDSSTVRTDSSTAGTDSSPVPVAYPVAYAPSVYGPYNSPAPTGYSQYQYGSGLYGNIGGTYGGLLYGSSLYGNMDGTNSGLYGYSLYGGGLYGSSGSSVYGGGIYGGLYGMYGGLYGSSGSNVYGGGIYGGLYGMYGGLYGGSGGSVGGSSMYGGLYGGSVGGSLSSASNSPTYGGYSYQYQSAPLSYPPYSSASSYLPGAGYAALPYYPTVPDAGLAIPPQSTISGYALPSSVPPAGDGQ